MKRIPEILLLLNILEEFGDPDANIVISSGDLLDMMTSNVERAFITGREINLNSQNATNVVPALEFLIASNKKGLNDKVENFENGRLSINYTSSTSVEHLIECQYQKSHIYYGLFAA